MRRIALEDQLEYVTDRWYAVYTSANHEKRIAQQLAAQNLEYFLPLYESVRRWKDRRVLLHMPLFPGYIFVRVALQHRLLVQRLPGVARFVGFGGSPIALPEQDIEALRKSFSCGVRMEPHPFLAVGRCVSVRSGPLVGMRGILVKHKSKCRLVVSIELIRRAVAVEIDGADLDPVENSERLTLGKSLGHHSWFTSES